MMLEPGTLLGQYRIMERLGRGGMATVYKAFQPGLDRHVAIKVLPSFYAEEPSYLERFRQEAKAVARLRHPNILDVFDFGEQSGTTYLVSEFVAGGTLADRLGEPLSLDRTLATLKPVASALDYAHSRRVIHRDIKPSNILLTEDGVPIISDFGVAKIIGGTALTESGSSIGTPEYMAPEQALGRATVASDVYALGVVLYQMVTGKVPFSADTPMAVVLAHMHDPLPIPGTTVPDLPQAVQGVILKALAKRPEDRFHSAGEMVSELERALAEAQQTSAAVSPRGRAGKQAVDGDGAIPAGVVEAAQGQELKPSKPRRAFWRRLPAWGWVVMLVLLLPWLAVLSTSSGVLGRVDIAGTSMEPTLPPGRTLFYHRPYTGVRRGDIVLYSGSENRNLVARIVALPGETVEVRGGQLIVDGNVVQEPYVKEPMRYTTPLVRLGAGEYYVLSDNRNSSSSDSHASGPVQESQIFGVAY